MSTRNKNLSLLFAQSIAGCNVKTTSTKVHVYVELPGYHKEHSVAEPQTKTSPLMTLMTLIAFGVGSGSERAQMRMKRNKKRMCARGHGVDIWTIRMQFTEGHSPNQSGINVSTRANDLL